MEYKNGFNPIDFSGWEGSIRLYPML
jgi:hypothetical protein